MKVKRHKKNRRLFHTAKLILRHEPEEEKVIRALAGGPKWPERWFDAMVLCFRYERYSSDRRLYRQVALAHPERVRYMVPPVRWMYGL